MDRFVVGCDRNAFYIEDRGWEGGDCPKDEYPKEAIELRFGTRARAETVCNILNAEWQEFLRGQ